MQGSAIQHGTRRFRFARAERAPTYPMGELLLVVRSSSGGGRTPRFCKPWAITSLHPARGRWSRINEAPLSSRERTFKPSNAARGSRGQRRWTP